MPTEYTVWKLRSWNSWKPQQAQQPWATAVHADNGMFAIDTSGGCSLRFILLNLGKNFTAGTQTSSPSDYISSGKGVRIELTTGRTLRWLKYNPTTERWYIYIGGDDDSTGLYSWNDDTEYTTSTTGNNVHIESGSNFFTKETSFNFPDEKMTCPARISSTTWLSYTSAGVAYYSTDLITWTLATADLFHPTDYAMKNVGTDGIAYYGKKGSDSIVTVSSGFSTID